MADMKYDIDSSDLVRARKEIRAWSRDNQEAFNRVNSRMQTFGKTSELAFNQFGRAATQAQQKSKRFASVGLQQAGYQIGDFAVQVQGGTNALVAFGQQGSQLAGIFGAGGAVAGALIAIGTAVLNVWYQTNKAKQSIKEFEESLESARGTVKGMAEDLKALRSGIENAFERTLLDNVKRAEERLKSARQALESFPDISPDRSGAQARQAERDAAEEAVRLAERELLSARELLRQQKEEERNASIANQLYEARLIIREREAEISEAIRKGTTATIGPAKTLRNETAKYVENMADVFTNTQKLKEELGDAAFEALRLSGVDMQSGVDKAAKAAARLAAQLGVSFATAQRLQNLGSTRPRARPFEGQLAFEERRAAGQTRPQMRPMDLGIPEPSFGGGGSSVEPSDPREFLKELEREIELKRLLVGVNEAQAERLKIEARLKEELLETGGKVTEADRERIAALVKQSEAIRKAEEAEERRRANIERFENQMSDSITNVVKEAQSIEDAFIGVIRNIVEELFRQNVAKPIASGIGSFIGGLLPNANGNAFSGGRVTAFADGGVVSKPTMFPMANGAGLMGEAGPEAIMPLKRGKGGKLGVAAEGGSSGPVTVNNHFHIAANGDDSVRRIIQSEAPKISAMTEKQIINSRRRGGSMKQAFG